MYVLKSFAKGLLEGYGPGVGSQSQPQTLTMLSFIFHKVASRRLNQTAVASEVC